MKLPSGPRWRNRLAAPVVAVCCTALALLAGAVPASATQSTAQTGLTVSAGISQKATQCAPQGDASPGSAATRPDITARCGPALNEYNRTQFCWNNTLTFTFFEDEDPVGTSVVTLIQYIVLRPGTKSWTEYDTVTTVTSEGTTAPIEVVQTVTCGSDCKATGGLKGTLKAGLTATISYITSVGKDKDVTDASTYSLVYDAPPYIPTNDLQWDSPIKFRCDNSLGVANTIGCVFPKYVPTLVLSLKTGGASAAMVAWAQQHMDAHWGWDGHGDPLTRLTDETTIDDNRERICEDGTFHSIAGIGAPAKGTKDPWTDTDSCDEFPFAATNQSGGATLKKEGKTGAACVQLKAVRTSSSKTADEAAQWGGVTTTGSVNDKAPCVRGHIPNNLNGAVGSAYRGLIGSARLISGDPFWIAVES